MMNKPAFISLCGLGALLAAMASAQAPAASAKPSMVFVKGGSFAMGASPGHSGAAHSVKLDSFYISTHELLAEDFRSFRSETGYAATIDVAGPVAWDNRFLHHDDGTPAVDISWFDVVSYCNWRSLREGLEPAYSMDGEYDCAKWPSGWNVKEGREISCDFKRNGYRMPTEAEWEFAARGGNSGIAEARRYSGGDTPGDVGWYSGNSRSICEPVGKKAPNQLGLYDMSGNAHEWCWDWYADYDGSARSDPRGPAKGGKKTYRGGCVVCDAACLAVDSRTGDYPHKFGNAVGARLARSR